MIKGTRSMAGRLVAGLIAFSFLSIPVDTMAEGVSQQYTYNYWEQAVPTATSYLPEMVCFGSNMGVDGLNKPQDLYVTDKEEIFILDSGNSRLVVLDKDTTVNRIIVPTDPEGKTLAFLEASGLFVCSDGRILVADKKGGQVYILDSLGKQIGSIGAPDNTVVPENFVYQPIKVLEDSGGIIYVVSAGSYSGALQFEKDGTFMGFYGSEKVALTAKVMANYFWKNFLTEKQAEGLSRTVPVEFVSFCADKKDFLYTIRKGNDVHSGQVRKLNARGDSVLKDTVFGDRVAEQMLADIAVDDKGFISILDSGSGRVFQYDADGNLLYAFGGKSEQAGNFKVSVAIETLGDKLLVLDSERGLLTLLAPTQFAQNIRKATMLYRDGKYQEAMEPWQQVLTSDYTYELANLGMGKAYEGLGEFQTAMKYYIKANDRELYSSAYGEYRASFIRKYFPLFMILLGLCIVAPMVLVRKRLSKKVIYAGGRPARKYPFYCMFHPMAGYSDMKSEKKGSFALANAALLAFLAASIFIRQVTGFPFNYNRVNQFNLFVTICSTVGIFLAFVLCNWAVTTIMDGKGKFLEIWTFCSYALIPYAVLMMVVVGASNVMTIDEKAFYVMLQSIVYIWTGFAMLMAIKEVHQYTLGKTIATLLITFAAMIIVIIIVAILYSVFSQFLSFLATLWTEILLHT